MQVPLSLRVVSHPLTPQSRNTVADARYAPVWPHRLHVHVATFGVTACTRSTLCPQTQIQQQPQPHDRHIRGVQSFQAKDANIPTPEKLHTNHQSPNCAPYVEKCADAHVPPTSSETSSPDVSWTHPTPHPTTHGPHNHALKKATINKTASLTVQWTDGHEVDTFGDLVGSLHAELSPGNRSA